MYKFIISLQLQPGARDQILARAPEVQAAARAEPGCIANDFYTCSDDPDRLVFRILEIEGGPRMAFGAEPHQRLSSPSTSRSTCPSVSRP